MTNAVNGGTGYSVLVVEDDPHVARLIEANLQKVKMECRCAPDGKSALAAFKQKEPHLVLLDLMLPDMTGYEVCAKIREESNVPIIMVTARNGDGDQLHGLKVGADDYVTKPFTPQLLMARVVAHLRRVHRYGAGNETVATGAAAQTDWTKCTSCAYMGPKEKFEQMNDQFQLSMLCPNCNTRVKAATLTLS